MTWNFATVWDGIAQEVPDRDAVVCADRRSTWGEFSARSHRLAAHFQSLGLTAGSKVAIDLPNCPEYLETFYAALVLGAVPVNVNYRYTADEVHYVVDDSDAKVVVHSADVTRAVTKACKRIQRPWRPATLEVGAPYEAALAAAGPTPDPPHEPSGDDLVFIYTGGTTGMPKGVMWRNEDLYVGLWVQAHPNDREPPDPIVAARAGKRAGTRLPVSPLMHGTGLMTTLATMAGGGTIVLIDHKGLDVEQVWDTVEREQVRTITIVGDVFARPLLDALVLHPGRWNLSCLRGITSSGVLFSPDVKHGLLRELPGLTIVDTLGASEGMGPSNASTSDDAAIAPARFRVSDRVSVIDETTGRPVTPGSDEVGLVAMGGNIPIGYYNDPVKTAATFRVFDGTRYSVPGDYATVAADGTVHLFGTRFGVHQHRWREGVPRGGRARAQEARKRLRLRGRGCPRPPLRREGRRLRAGHGAPLPRCRRAHRVVEAQARRLQDAARVALRRRAPTLARGQGRPAEAAGARDGAPRDRASRLTASTSAQAPRARGAPPQRRVLGTAAASAVRSEAYARSRPVRLAS